MFTRQSIYDAFKDLEKLLGPHASDVQFTLVGSSSLILNHELERLTHDIDVVTSKVPMRLAGLGSALDDLGFQAVSDMIVFLHPDYAERAQPLETGTKLQVKVLAPEDIAVSKIGRGLRKDFDDLLESSVLRDLDLSKVEELYLETLDYQIGDVTRLQGNLESFMVQANNKKLTKERMR